MAEAKTANIMATVVALTGLVTEMEVTSTMILGVAMSEAKSAALYAQHDLCREGSKAVWIVGLIYSSRTRRTCFTVMSMPVTGQQLCSSV